VTRWVYRLLLILLGLMLVWAAHAQSDDETSGDGDESDELGPTLPWEGESPHWEPKQDLLLIQDDTKQPVWNKPGLFESRPEFSAVKGAPFIGATECLYCHKELKAGYLKTAHARTLIAEDVTPDQQGCEACHGAGGAHAVLKSRGAIFAFDWKDPKYTNDICLRCHSWLTSGDEWPHTGHGRAGLKCTTCHDPHVPADTKERFMLREREEALCLTCHDDVGHDFSRLSHHPVQIDAANDPGARVLHCTSCHDLHAGTGPNMISEKRVQDLCVRCHVDKGGPFLFAHMGTEEGIGQGCLSCHAAHGSDSPWLGVMDGRSMCIQCHTDREEHNQPLTCWTTGCHTTMHGSNQSPLFFK
jgi:DmsE family decaheme c-type cytochrome